MADHRHQPRTKCTRDLAELEDLCKTYARSIVRYRACSDIEETVKGNRAFLVELAALTPRVSAPMLAKAVKNHTPEFVDSERNSWANAMKQAIQYCYTHREVKKLSPATAAVAKVLRRHERAGAPTLPNDARPKPLAAPASSTREPEPLRSPPTESEIAAVYGNTPRTPTKRALVALSSPSPSTSADLTSSAALTMRSTTKKRLTRKQSMVDLLTPPAAEKPAPKRSVREVDYNRMKLKETDDSGELREFDLAPGDKGMCVAILADGTTWTSEITNADFAAWKNPPPVNKKPAKSMKKPVAAPGTWREDEDEGMSLDEGEGEEGEGEEEEKMDTADEAEGPEQDDDEKDGGILVNSALGPVKLGNKFGPFPKPAAAAVPKAAAKLKAKPAAAEVLMAKPAAADLGKFTDEKGRTFDHKTEQFAKAMYYKKSHSVGLRIKNGGRQLISFGGWNCTNSKEYLLETARQLQQKLNEGKLGLIEAKQRALSRLRFE